MNDMQLQLVAELSGRKLAIEYNVSSQLTVEAYVHHIRLRDEKPNAAVYFLRPSTILLFCGTVPRPPGVFLYWPGRPGAERIRPGGVVRGTLEYALPLLEASQHYQADPHLPHQACLATRVRMVVEYRTRMRGLKVKEYPGGGLFDAWGVDALTVQAEVPLSYPVEVWRREDDYDRPFGA